MLQSTGRSGNDLAGTAYRQIREAILRMDLQPGQKLQEVALAEWLGTSRTPVREALRRLQTEGLIESYSARGLVVAEVSIEDIDNAYLVIEALEALSCRLAAQRLGDEGAAKIRALLIQMQEAASAAAVERWTKADHEYHDVIRDLSGNPKLQQVANLVYPVIERVRDIWLREGPEPDRLAGTTDDHVAVGEAILAGDAERAEALGKELFVKARLNNVRLLRHWVAPLRRSF